LSVQLLDLQLIYGVAGARQKFEDLTSDLVQSENQSGRKVRLSRGDAGIDVYIGDWGSPDGIDVYQAKFFPGGVGEIQKQQIRDSFKSCRDDERFSVRTWTLCLPCDFSVDETKWFDEWKSKQHGITICTPWTASKLERLLNQDNNRGTKEAYFKEEHLAQIREMHSLLVQLVADFNERVPTSPRPSVLVPRFWKAEGFKCYRDESRVLASIKLWFQFENPGSVAVTKWQPKFTISRDKLSDYIVTDEQCPEIRSGQSSIQLDRSILPTLCGQDSMFLATPIDPAQPLNTQLKVAFSEVQLTITPVTDNNVSPPKTFDLDMLLDYEALSMELAHKLSELHRKEAPKQITFPDTPPRYDFSRDCLSFWAIADGKRVRCVITEEAIIEKFHLPCGGRTELEDAFASHKLEIHAAAKEVLHQGGIGDEVTITTANVWPTE
tara:strand:+ start:102 stop:1412 length:1311 start_codon:yes stop_codon:yes gene_type:complete